MITIENVTVGYEEKTILDHVNLTLPKGKVIALLGPNGSGKSTLIKALARVNPLRTGSVLIDEHNLTQTAMKQIAKQIAFLPQTLESYAAMSVYDLVTLGRFPYRNFYGALAAADYEKVDWALEMLELTSLRDVDVQSLSGGQKQRAWIAMVLAQDTPYILLDEPTSYLDINYQLEVLHLIRTLNEVHGKTVIFSHHDLNQAAQYADEILVMKQGVVYAQGDAQTVMTAQMLKDVFEVSANVVVSEQGVELQRFQRTK